MVILSEYRVKQYKDDNHLEDAPHFKPTESEPFIMMTFL